MAPHIIDFLDKGFERISDVYVRESTCFNEQKVVLAGELFGTTGRDGALSGITLNYIKLVTNKHKDNLWLGVIFHLVNPFFDIIE